MCQSIISTFVVRVKHNESLGITPCRKERPKVAKKKNLLLLNHKKWLKDFGENVKKRREEEEHGAAREQQKRKMIKERGEKDRQRTMGMVDELRVIERVLGPLEEDEEAGLAQTQPV